MNFDAGAWKAATGEVSLLGLNKDDLAIDSCMDGKVAAHESARAGNLCCAGLTDEDFASLD